jgi:hypothetical protein
MRAVAPQIDDVGVGADRGAAAHQTAALVSGCHRGQGQVDHLGDLAVARLPAKVAGDDPDERVDRIAGHDCRDWLQRTDQLDRLRWEPNLLVRLAQRGRHQVCVLGVTPSARE